MACNTMVERMARAMCTEITGRNAYSNLTTTKEILDRMALAALRELRDPTGVMVDGGVDAVFEHATSRESVSSGHGYTKGELTDEAVGIYTKRFAAGFTASIDAAIAEAAAAGRAPTKKEGE